MSSATAIVGAVNRALDRLGKKCDFRRDSMKEFEERLLREAITAVGSDFAACLELSINDLWNKPAALSADNKRIRQGKLREVLSIITPHDTPIEKFIHGGDAMAAE